MGLLLAQDVEGNDKGQNNVEQYLEYGEGYIQGFVDHCTALGGKEIRNGFYYLVAVQLQFRQVSPEVGEKGRQLMPPLFQLVYRLWDHRRYALHSTAYLGHEDKKDRGNQTQKNGGAQGETYRAAQTFFPWASAFAQQAVPQRLHWAENDVEDKCDAKAQQEWGEQADQGRQQRAQQLQVGERPIQKQRKDDKQHQRPQILSVKFQK